ncbi:MAG: hypothetical protein QM758_07175 [Armatimonas sp.]
MRSLHTPVLLALLFLGIVGSAIAQSPTPPADPRLIFGTALARLETNSDETAVRKAMEGLKKDFSDFAPPYYLLAQLDEEADHFEEAAVGYESYLRKTEPPRTVATDDPSRQEATAALERVRNTIRLLRDPAKRNVWQYDRLIERARTALSVQNLRLALRFAGDASALQPERWESYSVAGAILAMAGKWLPAADAYHEASEKAEARFPKPEQETALKAKLQDLYNEAKKAAGPQATEKPR